jgi:hypothetical protein
MRLACLLIGFAIGVYIGKADGLERSRLDREWYQFKLEQCNRIIMR